MPHTFKSTILFCSAVSLVWHFHFIQNFVRSKEFFNGKFFQFIHSSIHSFIRSSVRSLPISLNMKIKTSKWLLLLFSKHFWLINEQTQILIGKTTVFPLSQFNQRAHFGQNSVWFGSGLPKCWLLSFQLFVIYDFDCKCLSVHPSIRPYDCLCMCVCVCNFIFNYKFFFLTIEIHLVEYSKNSIAKAQ